MTSSIVRSIACIVLLVLCLNMFMVLQGRPENKFSFGRLLEIASEFDSNFNKLGISSFIDMQIPQISEDWGVFNFFRDFLNSVIAPINVCIFFIGAFAYLIGFVFFLLPYILF